MKILRTKTRTIGTRFTYQIQEMEEKISELEDKTERKRRVQSKKILNKKVRLKIHRKFGIL